jgi:hypothetical protein
MTQTIHAEKTCRKGTSASHALIKGIRASGHSLLAF